MAEKFRQTLVRLLGRTPARAALQPKVLERVALSGFVREKVSYMVEPGQRVSAYLFLPAGEGRHPAVLCLHQHNR
ncbi:MAG: dienelactone hydrolase, partial [candidate division NC10 bacterium]|nr:dienelactone hydrolase [candidate division NC10 bacterium]